ncbi:MAG: hypothetical protein ABIP64_02905 [Burkholderiales bacterium]
MALADGTHLAESTAIARYLDHPFPGRKVMGDPALEQGQDDIWDSRIFIHVLYRMVTTFHVMHQG